MKSSGTLVYYWYPAMFSFAKWHSESLHSKLITFGCPQTVAPNDSIMPESHFLPGTQDSGSTSAFFCVRRKFFSFINTPARMYVQMKINSVQFLTVLSFWSSFIKQSVRSRINHLQFTKWVYKWIYLNEEHFRIESIVNEAEIPAKPQ